MPPQGSNTISYIVDIIKSESIELCMCIYVWKKVIYIYDRLIKHDDKQE